MPNNRYTDPLAYQITNNPGHRYSVPMVNYTAGMDRITDIVRNANSTSSLFSNSGGSGSVSSSAGSSKASSFLWGVGKLAGLALLAGAVALASSGDDPEKK